MSNAVFKYKSVEAYKFLGLDKLGNRLYEGVQTLDASRKFDRFARTTLNDMVVIKVLDHTVDLNIGDYVVYHEAVGAVIDVCSEKLFNLKYLLY